MKQELSSEEDFSTLALNALKAESSPSGLSATTLGFLYTLLDQGAISFLGEENSQGLPPCVVDMAKITSQQQPFIGKLFAEMVDSQDFFTFNEILGSKEEKIPLVELITEGFRRVSVGGQPLISRMTLGSETEKSCSYTPPPGGVISGAHEVLVAVGVVATGETLSRLIECAAKHALRISGVVVGFDEMRKTRNGFTIFQEIQNEFPTVKMISIANLNDLEKYLSRLSEDNDSVSKIRAKRIQTYLSDF